jgi:hypothetical protein
MSAASLDMQSCIRKGCALFRDRQFNSSSPGTLSFSQLEGYRLLTPSWRPQRVRAIPVYRER